MSRSPVIADVDGLHVTASLAGPCAVAFDGVRVWSFAPPDPGPRGGSFVAWPHSMRPWLRGRSRVSVVCLGRELDAGEVDFGQGEGRVEFVDEHGIPVVIDKWGLVQRQFLARGEEVVEFLVDRVEQVLDILERDCGIRAWLAFGSLLGAVRSGGVIGHDSDVDLAYLSHRTTPAAMALEMFAIKRALTRHGLEVVNKTSSFVTVRFTAPDGALVSLDLYTCFYVGDHLHETATVRARVPREAIEPLGRLEFHGRLLPAPADPDALLAVSYGPGWRTPDPSFEHQPGPDVNRRFNAWFPNLMRHRRDWERFWQETSAGGALLPSAFSSWVDDRLAAGSSVVDVGAGNGSDAMVLSSRGHRVLAVEYARGITRRLVRPVWAQYPDLEFRRANLYDLRDVLTLAGLVVRDTGRPRAVYARNLLDAVEVDGLENFWRFVRVVLRGGGTAFLEFDEIVGDGFPGRFYETGGRRFRVSPVAVQQQLAAAGGRVLETETGPVEQPEAPDPARRRWRIVATWER